MVFRNEKTRDNHRTTPISLEEPRQSTTELHKRDNRDNPHGFPKRDNMGQLRNNSYSAIRHPDKVLQHYTKRTTRTTRMVFRNEKTRDNHRTTPTSLDKAQTKYYSAIHSGQPGQPAWFSETRKHGTTTGLVQCYAKPSQSTTALYKRDNRDNPHGIPKRENTGQPKDNSYIARQSPDKVLQRYTNETTGTARMVFRNEKTLDNHGTPGVLYEAQTKYYSAIQTGQPGQPAWFSET